MKKYFLISSVHIGLASSNLFGQPVSHNSPIEGALSQLHLNCRISSAGFMTFLGHRHWK